MSTNGYTPGTFRVGLCTRCGVVISLEMPAKPGVDVDRILNEPRECPGMHVEMRFSDYYWPWRQWPEIQPADREAFVELLYQGKREQRFPHDVRERIAKGELRLLPTGVPG